MTKYTAIIIDDEKSAIENLEILLKQFCPNVELVGTADNASDAVHTIHTNQPDIVFLDMNMPGLKGFDIIDMLPEQNFKIIVISGFQDYALEGIKHQVLDFILKPVDVIELTNAIKKMPPKEKINPNQITVSDLQKVYVVKAEEVIYIKADRAQTCIYRKNNDHLEYLSKPISYYEESFKNYNCFYRCNQSYLINMNEIKMYLKGDNQAVMSNGDKIPVSRDKKERLLELLKGFTNV